MTREKAIEKLELMRQKVDEETYRALILAIKALEQNESAEKWYKLFVEKLDEQEPCDDAISREYLKKIAQSEGAYGYVSAYDIATAPSVTPSNKIIEDIKAEIQTTMDMYKGCEYIGDKARRDELWHVLEIIDKHIRAESEDKE